jgi:hypothetical protein
LEGLKGVEGELGAGGKEVTDRPEEMTTEAKAAFGGEGNRQLDDGQGGGDRI